VRYIGGKSRVAKRLAAAILPHAQGRRLVEPFCGGLSATMHLKPAIASDSNPYLIDLVNAVRDGWVPPNVLSHAEYHELKDRYKAGESDPLISFAAICCSFGGKWWGGYARGGASEMGRNFCREGKNGLLKKVEATRGTTFTSMPYNRVRVRSGDVLYCDPPYTGTTNGYLDKSFDSEAFWDWCQWAADLGALVFVSEFKSPPGTKLHKAFMANTDLNKKGNQTTIERLYVLGS